MDAIADSDENYEEEEEEEEEEERKTENGDYGEDDYHEDDDLHLYHKILFNHFPEEMQRFDHSRITIAPDIIHFIYTLRMLPIVKTESAKRRKKQQQQQQQQQQQKQQRCKQVDVNQFWQTMYPKISGFKLDAQLSEFVFNEISIPPHYEAILRCLPNRQWVTIFNLLKKEYMRFRDDERFRQKLINKPDSTEYQAARAKFDLIVAANFRVKRRAKIAELRTQIARWNAKYIDRRLIKQHELLYWRTVITLMLYDRRQSLITIGSDCDAIRRVLRRLRLVPKPKGRSGEKKSKSTSGGDEESESENDDDEEEEAGEEGEESEKDENKAENLEYGQQNSIFEMIFSNTGDRNERCMRVSRDHWIISVEMPEIVRRCARRFRFCEMLLRKMSSSSRPQHHKKLVRVRMYKLIKMLTDYIFDRERIDAECAQDVDHVSLVPELMRSFFALSIYDEFVRRIAWTAVPARFPPISETNNNDNNNIYDDNNNNYDNNIHYDNSNNVYYYLNYNESQNLQLQLQHSEQSQWQSQSQSKSQPCQQQNEQQQNNSLSLTTIIEPQPSAQQMDYQLVPLNDADISQINAIIFGDQEFFFDDHDGDDNSLQMINQF